MIAALLGLGSNLGAREENLSAALQRLSRAPGIASLRASRFYDTRPAGGPAAQQRFLNASAVVSTTLTPQALLALLQRVEAEAGRQRGERWAARELDLDLLLFGEETSATADLTVPHPRMSFRRFVLEPAVEIAAEMLFPATQQPIAALLRWLDEQPPLIALTGPPELTNVANQLAEEWRSAEKTAPSRRWDSLYSRSPHLLKPLPRLVVVISDGRDLPVWLQAWRGPRLILPASTTAEEIRREVLAARIAME